MKAQRRTSNHKPLPTGFSAPASSQPPPLPPKKRDADAELPKGRPRSNTLDTATTSSEKTKRKKWRLFRTKTDFLLSDSPKQAPKAPKNDLSATHNSEDEGEQLKERFRVLEVAYEELISEQKRGKVMDQKIYKLKQDKYGLQENLLIERLKQQKIAQTKHLLNDSKKKNEQASMRPPPPKKTPHHEK